MWFAVKAVFGKSWGYLVQIAAIVATAFSVAAILYKYGKDARKAEELASVMKDEKKAHAIHDENRAKLRAGDALDSLRNDWS